MIDTLRITFHVKCVQAIKFKNLDKFCIKITIKPPNTFVFDEQ